MLEPVRFRCQNLSPGSIKNLAKLCLPLILLIVSILKLVYYAFRSLTDGARGPFYMHRGIIRVRSAILRARPVEWGRNSPRIMS